MGLILESIESKSSPAIDVRGPIQSLDWY